MRDLCIIMIRNKAGNDFQLTDASILFLCFGSVPVYVFGYCFFSVLSADDRIPQVTHCQNQNMIRFHCILYDSFPYLLRSLEMASSSSIGGAVISPSLTVSMQ